MLFCNHETVDQQGHSTNMTPGSVKVHFHGFAGHFPPFWWLWSPLTELWLAWLLPWGWHGETSLLQRYLSVTCWTDTFLMTIKQPSVCRLCIFLYSRLNRYSRHRICVCMQIHVSMVTDARVMLRSSIYSESISHWSNDFERFSPAPPSYMHIMTECYCQFNYCSFIFIIILL